jgi:hypothetical protein
VVLGGTDELPADVDDLAAADVVAQRAATHAVACLDHERRLAGRRDLTRRH